MVWARKLLAFFAAWLLVLFFADKKDGAPPVALYVTTQKKDALHRHRFRQGRSEDVGVAFLAAGNGVSGDDALTFDVPSEYPPFLLNWNYYEALTLRALWNIRCDSDVVLNTDSIRLALVESQLDPESPVYMGTAGYGRESDRKRLKMGVNGFRAFAMGGCCEVLSRGAVKLMHQHKDLCTKRREFDLGPYTPETRHLFHHDVEIGRCMSALNVSLTVAPWKCTTLYGSGGRLPGILAQEALAYRSAAVVHPVKDPLTALVMQSNLTIVNHRCSHSPLSTRIRTSCTGFAWEGDGCSRLMDRCPLLHPVKRIKYPIKAKIMTIDDRKARSVLHKMPSVFEASVHAGTDNRNGPSSEFLRPGEIGVLKTFGSAMRDFLEHSDEPYMGFFEDDVMFSVNFTRSFINMPCAHEMLFNDGVVLLGFTNWNWELWPELLLTATGDHCVDVTIKTLGAFAFILTRAAAKKILWWIEATALTKPFDHVWGDLVELGVPAMAAFPHLAIADVSSPSTTNANRTPTPQRRIRLSRWGDGEYK